MIKLTQYENLFSIYFSLLAIIPCIILNFIKKKNRVLILLSSLSMIVLMLGIRSIQMVQFVLFVVFETLLVYGYWFFRKRCTSELVYFCVFIASCIPIFWVKKSLLNENLASYAGFVGLSYICFKLWQIIMEVHDGKIKELGLLDFWNFTLFFPSFSSGPIARYQPFKDDLNSNNENYFEEQFVTGLKRLLKGVFYKFALAFFVNKYILLQLPDEKKLIYIIIYVYAYTIYLFFDFAGYTEIAIGMGLLLGIKLPENFNHPFLSCNMKEFWTRWHISLSTWFQDYVYSRFVLNNIRNGLFKNKKIAGRTGLFITMLVMGFWHGFSAHYIIYGIYHGTFLTLSDYWVSTKTYRKVKKMKYYNLISRFITFNILSFGMLIFTGKYLFE